MERVLGRANTRDIMKNIRGNDMIIIGNVVGSKKIKSLGFEIKYKEEKVISESVLQNVELRNAIENNEILLTKDIYYTINNIQKRRNDKVVNANIQNVAQLHNSANNNETQTITANDIKKIVNELNMQNKTDIQIENIVDLVITAVNEKNNAMFQELKDILSNINVSASTSTKATNVNDNISEINIDEHVSFFQKDLENDKSKIDDKMSENKGTVIKKLKLDSTLNKLNRMEKNNGR